MGLLSNDLKNIADRLVDAKHSINDKYEAMRANNDVAPQEEIDNLYINDLSPSIEKIECFNTYGVEVDPAKVLEGVIVAADGKLTKGTMKDFGNVSTILHEERATLFLPEGHHDESIIKIQAQEKTVRAGLKMQLVEPDEEHVLARVFVDGVQVQEKIIKPSRDPQDILPDPEFLLSKVHVKGDPDLLPENIKPGIEIFGVVGSMPLIDVNTILDVNQTCVNIPEGYSDGTGIVKIQLEEKEVIPGMDTQVVLPLHGYVLSRVTVTGDPDLRPENIKPGVEIFGVVGKMPLIRINEILDVNKTMVKVPEGYSDGTGQVQIQLQTKSVVPGQLTKHVTPDNKYVLSKVTVEGDPDLLPQNLLPGVEIFGVKSNLVDQSENGIIKLNAADPDKTLSAGWYSKPIEAEINEYAVVYVINQQGHASVVKNIPIDTTWTCQATVPTIDDMEFLGWNTSPTAQVALYTNGQQMAANFAPKGDTGILYAVYKENGCEIYGDILDAQTGQKITGVAFAIKIGSLSASGGTGSYSVSGKRKYSYNLTCSASGYITANDSFTTPDATSHRQDIVISRELAVGEVARIVLKWGSSPSDLDTHFDGQLTGGPTDTFGIMYNNPAFVYNGENVIVLDVDDTDGGGPETLTLFRKELNGIYSVVDFTGTTMCHTSTAAVSVTIYMNDGTQQTIYIKKNNSNAKTWNVFRINNGVITILDQYFDEQGNLIDGNNPDIDDPDIDDDITDFSEVTQDEENNFTYMKQGWILHCNTDKKKTLYKRAYNIFKNNGQNSSYYVKKYGTEDEYIEIESITSGQSFDDNISRLGFYFGDLGFTVAEAEVIIFACMYDCPELMWKFADRYFWNDNSGMMWLPFFPESTRQAYLNTCKNTFNTICSQIATTYGISFDSSKQPWQHYTMHTEQEKLKIAKVIHDWIVLHNNYAYSSVEHLDQTMYPALSNGAETPVCASYAHAFQYCCERWGIVNGVVTGDAGEAHMWSIISYQTTPSTNPTFFTANRWQECDVTWDDPTGAPSTYCTWEHFNITTAVISTKPSSGRVRNAVNSASAYPSYFVTNATCTSNKYTGSTVYGGL